MYRCEVGEEGNSTYCWEGNITGRQAGDSGPQEAHGWANRQLQLPVGNCGKEGPYISDMKDPM